ncbi:hypothetical protein CAEBREN_31396 [Caenorhabditis brenneri]|uniref:Major facilitator superfamily (MFS) profile domain-containing protein n=1 Tax=Caenorhabditis brenneri TaxID=135651 RepID=G0M7K8_CAEBE|nr:hypothetical protein CAEBREN_31396 [Caenorhabditis brenneri]
MKFSVPRNILYMIVVTMLLDIINQIQVLTFSTLAEVVGEMNNHTLVNHFGLQPTKARFAITFATAICQLLATLFQASEVYLLGQLILGSHYCLRTFVSAIYILECAPDNCRDEVLTSTIKEKSLTEEKKLTLRQVWENETLREALKILLAVLIFLEFDTSYVISTYTLLLHKTAGFSVIAAMNINLIVTIVLLPTKCMGTFILDAFGRRPTMMIAGTMQFVEHDVVVESLAAIVPATGVHSIRVLFVSELFPPAAKTAVGQARTLAAKRNSILNTPRTRALTFDHKFILSKN